MLVIRTWHYPDGLLLLKGRERSDTSCSRIKIEPPAGDVCSHINVRNRWRRTAFGVMRLRDSQAEPGKFDPAEQRGEQMRFREAGGLD